MRFLDSSIIAQQRLEVSEETRAKYPILYERFYFVFDALVLVAYAFEMPDKVPDQPIERVQAFAQRVLYSSVFAFHASFGLLDQGFYKESISLNRGLMESLVTIIYLADSPADIDRLHRMSAKVTNHLKFRDRFERVIPGYYETHYKLSSEFTHPGLASHVLKIRMNGDGSYKSDAGLIFNVDSMSMCVNELAILSAGFLKAYLEKFQWQLAYKHDSHEKEIRDARVTLAIHIIDHMRFKGENDWHRLTRPLWDFNSDIEKEAVEAIAEMRSKEEKST